MIVNFRRQISTNSWISSKMTWDTWTPSFSPLRSLTRGWASLSSLSPQQSSSSYRMIFSLLTFHFHFHFLLFHFQLSLFTFFILIVITFHFHLSVFTFYFQFSVLLFTFTFTFKELSKRVGSFPIITLKIIVIIINFIIVIIFTRWHWHFNRW